MYPPRQTCPSAKDSPTTSWWDAANASSARCSHLSPSKLSTHQMLIWMWWNPYLGSFPSLRMAQVVIQLGMVVALSTWCLVDAWNTNHVWKLERSISGGDPSNPQIGSLLRPFSLEAFGYRITIDHHNFHHVTMTITMSPIQGPHDESAAGLPPTNLPPVAGETLRAGDGRIQIA